MTAVLKIAKLVCSSLSPRPQVRTLEVTNSYVTNSISVENALIDVIVSNGDDNEVTDLSSNTSGDHFGRARRNAGATS